MSRRSAHALARFARFGGLDTVQFAEEDELIEDFHFLVEAAFFGQVADALQALAVEGVAEEVDRSRVGMVMPMIMRMELVLPAPFVPAGRTSGRLNGETQVVDGDLLIVGLGHSYEFYNWHAILPAVEAGGASRKASGGRAHGEV